MKKLKNNVKNLYVLSPMQAGMLFHFLKDENTQAYVQQISWQIEGHLDFALFEAAWNELIRRHDILRTLFVYRNVDEPLQVVLEERRLVAEVVDIGDLGGAEQAAFRRDFKQRERERPFALDREILIRVRILVLGPQRCEVVLTHHHIIMDGWSLGNLVKESLDIYGSLARGEPPPPGNARPYRDYIRWLQARDEPASAAFWKDYVAGYEAPASAPQTPRAEVEKGAPQGIHLEMPQPLVERLARLGLAHGATLNTVLQALWGVLLCRYNNTPDVIFGAVVSGRPQDLPGVESMAGIFINTIPVRVRLRDAMSVGELLAAMQEEALHCERHHTFPLARIQAETPLRERLLGSLFVMENYPLDDLFEEGALLPGTQFRVTAMETHEETHFDFGIRFLPDAGMKIKIGFNPALYAEAQMQRLGGHLLRAAGQFAELGGAAPVDRIDILTPAERAQILGEFNATALDFPRDKTLAELFAEQVRKQPDAPALTCGESRLTYAQLDRRAEAVAARLRGDFAIRPDERVGLLLERSEWVVVGILAVLKAGGAYVPMESGFPVERQRYILADSACRVLLCDDFTAQQAAGHAPLAALNVMAIGREAAPVADLQPSAARPEHLAYVIYTSGSTGEPKGVMIEQRSVANLVAAMNRELYSRYPRRLNVALITTHVFDGSVQQIFSALLLGHHLFIMGDEIKRDTRRFSEFCLANRIDVAGCIPNFLALLHEAGELAALKNGLTHMIFGGEPLPRHLLDALLALPGEVTVSNLYGPTEICVNATAYTTAEACRTTAPVVSIGKPLGNVEALILDRWGGLAPLGVAGELCIAGAGVARGYLNNETLTREKFVTHPFQPGQRMFRTGDMARWLPDGNIEFLGRNDHQVKIAGYRIELGEIEEKLERHPLLREVAVVAVNEAGGRVYLRACVAAHQAIAAATLREHLAGLLPHYMIPAQFLFFEALPTTVSGKIDRKALMELAERPDAEGSEKAAAPPRNATEAALVEVWRAVFGGKNIGIDDDYFALGGDSIRAIQILSRLHRAGLKIDIKDLFNYPTIADLAPFVTQAATREQESVSGEVPLTPIQQRFLSEAVAAPEWFNHAVMLHAGAGFRDAAPSALQAACAHHPAFRLRFRRDESGTWRQEAAPDGEVLAFERVDLRGCVAERDEIARHAAIVQRSFDLAGGPLAKALLFQCGDGERLLIVVHHLIIDGVSWRIVIEDFAAACQDILAGQPIRLAPPSDTLQRWGRELHRHAQSPALLKQLAYWEKIENADIPPFPVENESPLNRHCDLVSATTLLATEETTALLGAVNQAYGTSTEEILLVALARALQRWKGVARSLIALEGHGREAVLQGLDVTRTVGWFTSLYPVVLELPDLGIGEQVKTLKEALRNVPDKGFGYGILKYLTPPGLKNGVAFAAQPRIRFNYLGQFGNSSETGAFAVTTDATGEGVNPETPRSVDIDISAMVLEKELELSVSCSRHRYGEDSLKAFLRLMEEEILAVSAHCRNQKTTELTPADLTSSDISLDELEGLFS
ncbi:MAG: amino acid adenylation domain-containing protein [Sulfuricella sp.]|nr:amino acid adenylation domain-containing protein [Sulfuricella sp.]